MIAYRQTRKIIIAVLVFTLVFTTIALGSNPVSAAEVPSGSFNPKAAMNKQGEYDSDTYYVYYNGDINTEMVDAGNKARGNEGAYGKASVIVTLDQKIVYIDYEADLTLKQWIAQEEGDKGVKIGTSSKEGADAIWINLRGETVMPGLMDSHIHYESGGGRRYSADIFWKPLAEIKAIIADVASKTADGEWISASGWNQTLDTWNGGDKKYGTKEDLDEVAPNHPVVLGRTDSHANWANSLAIRLSPYGGATKSGNVVTPGPVDEKLWPINTPGSDYYENPPGGVIIRDANGLATGIFVDGAMGTVSEYRPGTPSTGDRNAMSANDYLLSFGITSFKECGAAESSILRYEKLYNTGADGNNGTVAGQKMKPRGFILVRNANNNGYDTQADTAFRNKYYFTTEAAAKIGNGVPVGTTIKPYNENADGAITIVGDSTARATPGSIRENYRFDFTNTDYKLEVKSTKTSYDGALGSAGARLLEPYTNPGNADLPEGYRGAEERFTDEQTDNFTQRNLDSGWGFSTHAIGDQANNQTIDAVEKYFNELTANVGIAAVDASDLKTKGKFDPKKIEKAGFRPSTEHYQITSKGAIERSAALNWSPSMQFVHATSDMSMAGDRVGEARLQYSYAWRKVIDAGMNIANGTDWAVDLLNPYHGLSSGVTRMDRDDENPKSPRGVGVPWNPITTSISKASDERVTRAEAWHYYSYGGAYGVKQEDMIGSLLLGKLADFVVIDRDYLDKSVTEDSDIKDINALMTVIGGEICYTMGDPGIKTTAIGDGKVGATYAFTVTGETDFSPTYDWSIIKRDSGLEWLKIGYHSGVLSGTPTKAGTYKFTVKAENYLGNATQELAITINPSDVTLTDIAGAEVKGVKNTAYTGKQIKPKVTVTLNGKTLTENTDYTISHKNNVNVGKASVVITAKGDQYKGSKTVTYNIVPKKQKVASTKSDKKKQLTVKWKKDSQVTGYQVVIGTNKKITKNKKTANIKKKATVKTTFKKLKAGKVYYAKIRAYKTIDGKKVYGAWSPVKKTVKVKK